MSLYDRVFNSGQARLAEQTASKARLDAVKHERDLLAAERDELHQALGRTRVLHHQPERVAGEAGIVSQVAMPTDDRPLVQRIVTAYRSAMNTSVGSSDSIWLDFFANANKGTHETLSSGDLDRICEMLRNPAQSMLFYGFDNLSAAESARNQEARWRSWLHLLTYSSLLKLAEAVGIERLDNPEAPPTDVESREVEGILNDLDDVLGFRVEFPNLFAGEAGIATSRGVASYRAVQALYQAYRIRQLVGADSGARVLEIGAGLGRTALYACRAGLGAYSIADLPLTNVAQGYFLGRVLGETSVQLWGEEAAAMVRIAPPANFLEGTERYDLVVNFDSLTEMSPDTARCYFDAIAARSAQFLSINHEHNAFTVRDLYRERDFAPVFRVPCWVRRGYVEELLRFKA